MVGARIIRRVDREVADNPSDEKLKRLLDELLSDPAVPSRWRVLDLDGTPPPLLTVNYRCKKSTFRFFLTSLGTLLDVGLQGLRIAIFPADEATRILVNRLTGGAF